MKFLNLNFKSALLYLVCFLICSVYAKTDVLAAVFGGEALSGHSQSWKSTVFLEYAGGNCSAVFVRSDVVLTAAHCNIQNNSWLRIKFYPENSPAYTVKELSSSDFLFSKHPEFRDDNKFEPTKNDIAVIVLRNSLLSPPFAPAIIQGKAQAQASDPGKAIYAVGMGEVGSGKLGDRLKFAKGIVRAFYAGEQILADLEQGSGICLGDSGGPVFVSDEYGQLFLTGLSTGTSGSIGISGTENCGSRLYITAISAGRMSWIKNKIIEGRNKFQNM